MIKTRRTIGHNLLKHLNVRSKLTNQACRTFESDRMTKNAFLFA